MDTDRKRGQNVQFLHGKKLRSPIGWSGRVPINFLCCQKSVERPVCCINTVLIPNITYEKLTTFEKVSKFLNLNCFEPKQLIL